jgi:hypothetical protein
VTRVKIFILVATVGLACLACQGVGPRTVVRHENYVFEFGDYALEVDPDDGGRTVALSVAGHSAIVSRDESPEAYGSSLWPSPQSDWAWPPPPSFDKLPWRAHVDGRALVLESATDPKLGLSATERISAEPSAQHFASSSRCTTVAQSRVASRPGKTRACAPLASPFFRAQMSCKATRSRKFRRKMG